MSKLSANTGGFTGGAAAAVFTCRPCNKPTHVHVYSLINYCLKMFRGLLRESSRLWSSLQRTFAEPGICASCTSAGTAGCDSSSSKNDDDVTSEFWPSDASGSGFSMESTASTSTWRAEQVTWKKHKTRSQTHAQKFLSNPNVDIAWCGRVCMATPLQRPLTCQIYFCSPLCYHRDWIPS
jgi:hypothetical protein